MSVGIAEDAVTASADPSLVERKSGAQKKKEQRAKEETKAKFYAEAYMKAQGKIEGVIKLKKQRVRAPISFNILVI